jgi:hypothetical protein
MHNTIDNKGNNEPITKKKVLVEEDKSLAGSKPCTASTKSCVY